MGFERFEFRFELGLNGLNLGSRWVRDGFELGFSFGFSFGLNLVRIGFELGSNGLN